MLASQVQHHPCGNLQLNPVFLLELNVDLRTCNSTCNKASTRCKGFQPSAWLNLCRKGLLVQGIDAGLPLAAELLQDRGRLIGAVAWQGHPLCLGPLMLLGCLSSLHEAYEAAKLAL